MSPGLPVQGPNTSLHNRKEVPAENVRRKQENEVEFLKLINFAGRVRCPGHDMVVLLQQVHRLPGLNLLCAPQEVQSPVHAPRGAPWDNALHRLVGHQVRKPALREASGGKHWHFEI